ncbi:MAG: hypothetical protein ACRC8Y_03400 [Chroococcales cyanobacterium]
MFVVTTSVVTPLLGITPSNALRLDSSSSSEADPRPSDCSCDVLRHHTRATTEVVTTNIDPSRSPLLFVVTTLVVTA